jgi:hypothetical protein
MRRWENEEMGAMRRWEQKGGLKLCGGGSNEEMGAMSEWEI